MRNSDVQILKFFPTGPSGFLNMFLYHKVVSPCQASICSTFTPFPQATINCYSGKDYALQQTETGVYIHDIYEGWKHVTQGYALRYNLTPHHEISLYHSRLQMPFLQQLIQICDHLAKEGLVGPIGEKQGFQEMGGSEELEDVIYAVKRFLRQVVPDEVF